MSATCLDAILAMATPFDDNFDSETLRQDIRVPHYQQSCPPSPTDPPGGQTMSNAIALRPRAAG